MYHCFSIISIHHVAHNTVYHPNLLSLHIFVTHSIHTYHPPFLQSPCFFFFFFFLFSIFFHISPPFPHKYTFRHTFVTPHSRFYFPFLPHKNNHFLSPYFAPTHLSSQLFDSNVTSLHGLILHPPCKCACLQLFL